MNRKFTTVLILCIILLLGAFLFIQNNKSDHLQALAIYNENIEVGELKLSMAEEKVFTHIKSKPEEEMCVYGYEYNLIDRGLNLGFRMNDNTLRRITVKNDRDIIYDIKNGITLAEGVNIIQETNFQLI